MTPLETEILTVLSPRYRAAEWEVADDIFTLPPLRGSEPIQATTEEIRKALETLQASGKAILEADGWRRKPEPGPVEKQASLF